MSDYLRCLTLKKATTQMRLGPDTRFNARRHKELNCKKRFQAKGLLKHTLIHSK